MDYSQLPIDQTWIRYYSSSQKERDMSENKKQKIKNLEL